MLTNSSNVERELFLILDQVSDIEPVEGSGSTGNDDAIRGH